MAFNDSDWRPGIVEGQYDGIFDAPERALSGGFYRNMFKRWLDIVLVLIAAPFVVPVVAVLAVLIRRDGGPAFFLQSRVGRDGRIFRMVKLRTMVADADDRLAAHLAADPVARAEWESCQKLRRDPRITRFGAFLRKSSLDELPQFLNVLIGDMSIVGPRPMMVDQTSLYPGSAYFDVRPGVTGYWQVSGRNDTTFCARAQYDDAYVRDLSLGTDIRVMLRTAWVMLRGTGV